MGWLSNFLGFGKAAQDVGGAVESVAEVFTINKTKAEMATRAQAMASLSQYGAEFQNASQSPFDRFINGLNRLPRPILALGTVGLFIFAMADPNAFAGRMQGLAYVPDPLWWLLGAVVSFYFGARELHYARGGAQTVIIPSAPQSVGGPDMPVISSKSAEVTAIAPTSDASDNAALAEWLSQQKN